MGNGMTTTTNTQIMKETADATVFGAWEILKVEGRVALAKCRCGVVRQMALEALQSGASDNCGCMNSRTTRMPQRPSSFAGEVASLEARGGRKRQHGSGYGGS
jgi:hypothetical protein